MSQLKESLASEKVFDGYFEFYFIIVEIVIQERFLILSTAPITIQTCLQI